MTLFLEIDNTPRDYAWGQPDGVARVRGLVPSGHREAELWLGAHPAAPSRIVDDAPWSTLDEWERTTGVTLPFLLKILCAAEPLSLQAHPSATQAAEGFARENALAIPLDAPHRNYRDPRAKPEMIVALHDGFEALCGFRTAAEVLRDLRALAALLAPESEPTVASALGAWQQRVSQEGVGSAFLWLLAGDPALPPLVTAVSAAAMRDARFALTARIAEAHPDDPGILGALMLQHITLRAGEALWLPAGNVHAYLRGSGIELMGPSDNVMRGGLTGKHIDTVELARVLDTREGGDAHLTPDRLAEGVEVLRPTSRGTADDPGFELYVIDGDAEVSLPGPAIALATAGGFELASVHERTEVPRGRAVLISRPASIRITGSGRLFIAAG